LSSDIRIGASSGVGGAGIVPRRADTALRIVDGAAKTLAAVSRRALGYSVDVTSVAMILAIDPAVTTTLVVSRRMMVAAGIYTAAVRSIAHDPTGSAGRILRTMAFFLCRRAGSHAQQSNQQDHWEPVESHR
jgi:hypothetical protein